MRLTIIVPDSAVYVGNECRFNLDLSSCGIPENVQCLQWKDGSGWLEFYTLQDGSKPLNEPLTQLPGWAVACQDVWTNNPPPVPQQPPAIINPNS